MKRRMEVVDLIAAVGLFATIVAGGFLYMAANGELVSGASEIVSNLNATVDAPTVAMQWVQPVLGQAIVDNYLLERTTIQDIHAAAKELNHVGLMSQYRSTNLDPSFSRTADRVAEIDTDHTARMQYVMGRAIALFTARGVRSGELTPAQMEGPYNSRMIDLTDRRVQDLEAAYQESRQPLIGRMIVTDAHEALRSDAQIQHRLGEAIVRLAMLQDDHQAQGQAQTQLALVALASLHAEQVADRFNVLASAEKSLGPITTTSFTAPRLWPDISLSLLVAGSIALIGMFCAGLMMPGVRRDEQPAPRIVPVEPVYRKTA